MHRSTKTKESWRKWDSDDCSPMIARSAAGTTRIRQTTRTPRHQEITEDLLPLLAVLVVWMTRCPLTTQIHSQMWEKLCVDRGARMRFLTREGLDDSAQPVRNSAQSELSRGAESPESGPRLRRYSTKATAKPPKPRFHRLTRGCRRLLRSEPRVRRKLLVG